MTKVQQAVQFFKEVRIETRKATFPSRKDTIATTMVVLVVVIIIGFYLGVLDLVLSSVIGLVLK